MKIHPKVWEYIVRGYFHLQKQTVLSSIFDFLPLSKKFGVKDLQNVENEMQDFLKNLNLRDSLLILREVFDDGSLNNLKHDKWNYYGDYVREWPDKITDYLKRTGVSFDSEKKAFYINEQIFDIASVLERKNFLSSIFEDGFYKSLQEDINRTYNYRIFTATILLSRKIIENLTIDILRIKFPPITEDNLKLYYRKEDKRFHDFTILLKNLEEKKEYFELDKPIIEEFISLVKPFRPKANAQAHSIIMFGEEKEVLDMNIEKMVELLLKLKNHLITDLKNSR